MAASLICQRCNTGFESRRSDAKWCPDCRIIRAKENSRLYEGRQGDTCPECGASILRRAKLCRPCENKSRITKYKGANNPNWRNGWTTDKGYIYRRVGGLGHPYRPEHRLVWEEANGPLPKSWVVHHLNGVKNDNRLDNLAAMPRNSHHPDHLTKPYQKRIRELEVKLSISATEHQIGNSLDFTAMKTLGGNSEGDEDTLKSDWGLKCPRKEKQNNG